MNRRHLIGTGVGAAVALGQATRALAAAAEVDHSKMDHSTMAVANGPYPALAAAAGRCIASGETCLQHCLEMLAAGDRSMAGCAQSVRQMLSGCAALQELAVQKSAFTPRIAAVVFDICRQCESECERHAGTHAVCRACRDDCAACARECAAARAA